MKLYRLKRDILLNGLTFAKKDDVVKEGDDRLKRIAPAGKMYVIAGENTSGVAVLVTEDDLDEIKA